MKYDTILHNKLLHNILYIIDCYYHFNLFYLRRFTNIAVLNLKLYNYELIILNHHLHISVFIIINIYTNYNIIYNYI